MIGLPWLQFGCGEFGVIGRIWEVLGFQAEAGVLVVDVAVLARQGSIQEIAGVELYSGLSGFYGEYPAGGRL